MIKSIMFLTFKMEGVIHTTPLIGLLIHELEHGVFSCLCVFIVKKLISVKFMRDSCRPNKFNLVPFPIKNPPHATPIQSALYISTFLSISLNSLVFSQFCPSVNVESYGWPMLDFMASITPCKMYFNFIMSYFSKFS